MTARLERTRGQPKMGCEKKEIKHTCIHDNILNSIPFRLGDRACWAVRSEIFDNASDNCNEQRPAECDAGRLCGWLRIGKESYLVLTWADEADELDDQAAAKDEPWETLSEREMQIAILVSIGKGTKQIAGHLLISEHTVQSYMRRIFSKLHVSTRPAMVARLMKWRIRADLVGAVAKAGEGP
jgi:DNA-binding CsgD family transcriptional regulator